MAKRPKGDPIEIRKGVWQFRISLPKDSLTGKYPQLTRRVKAPNLTEARKAKQAAIAEAASARPTPSMPLRQLFDEWLIAKRLEGRAGRTLQGYEDRADDIKAVLGDIPISQLRREQVESFYSSLIDRDLSARSIDHYHRVLTNALRWAQDHEWIVSVPTRKITKPTPRKADLNIPTSDQVKALLAAARADSRETAMFVELSLDLWTRPAETVAIKWSKVDTNEATVMIDGAIDTADRTGRRKDTKTHAKRLLSIAPQTADALTDYREWLVERAKRLGMIYQDDGYLFCSDGFGSEPWHPGRASQTFGRLKKAAKVSGVRLYDLRHFGATRALAAGVPLPQVSYRLGHKLVSTTLDHYAHVIPGRDRDIPQLMNEFYTEQKELKQ